MPKKQLIGYCGVDSGQILLTDPCYLKDFVNDEYTHDTNKLDYSYSGACQASQLKAGGGQLTNKRGIDVAICVESGCGDGKYPVYVELDKDGRVKRAIIEF
jgi:hypothetical protein